MSRYVKYQVLKAVRSIRYSKFLNRSLPGIKDERLWKGTRESYSLAGFIGVLCAFIPMPFQMVFAAILAYKLKANIPLAVSLAWITNPLTMWPIWTGGYFFGVWLFNMQTLHFSAQLINETLFEWAVRTLPDIWFPFVFGNLVLGTILGGILYFAIRWGNQLSRLLPAIKRKKDVI